MGDNQRMEDHVPWLCLGSPTKNKQDNALVIPPLLTDTDEYRIITMRLLWMGNLDHATARTDLGRRNNHIF